MAALRYPPAKISVDPATPKAAVDKYKADGMSLIFSDEFKDLARTKAMFVFEDIPYGVPCTAAPSSRASEQPPPAASATPLRPA